MELRTTTHDLRQEFVNSLIHALGILFGIACMPILIYNAASTGNYNGVVGTAIYGFSFILVFSSSTFYHWAKHPVVKRRLEILDHISIYFLIAGTYTPLLLIYVRNGIGLTLLIVLWTLAGIGIVFKIFFTGRFNILSTIFYVLMGWMLVFAGESFFENMEWPVITLIITGGLLYTAGVYFYIKERFMYSHAVWHFLVLAAAICHYAAISLSI